MTPVLPRAASTPGPAALPPSGLPGMDPKFSRLVTVPASTGASASRSTDAAAEPGSAAQPEHTWHLLDNGAELRANGVEPLGTILCVHGNPTWSYLWRKLVSAATNQGLAGGQAWRVIAVDQLDMGFSQRTGQPRTLSQRVADLGRLTAHLELMGPVVTLGHDWGGVVSLGWAVDHTEKLAAVMTLNTAVHQPEEDPIPAPLRLALRRGVLGTSTVMTPAFLETTLALAHPPLPAPVKAAYRAPYRGTARRGGIGGFVADIPVDERHRSWPELERIAQGVSDLGAAGTPGLFLWGPTDPIFSDRYLRDLIGRMPQADVHRFEGAGHLIAEDTDYAATVLQWLSTRFSGGVPAIKVRPAQAATHDGYGALAGSLAARSEVDASQVAPPMWHHIDLLRHSAETALVEMAPGRGKAPRVVSWRLLAQRIDEIAAGLAKIGIRRGHRVSLLVQPGADLTAVLYACLRIGAIVVVADAGLGLRGLTRAVRGAGPQHIIGAVPGLAAARTLGWPGQRISTTPLPRSLAKTLGVSYSLADLVDLGTERDLPPPPSAGDLAAILFTSGSTGPAKGVAYTHGQLCAMRDVLNAQYGIGPGTGLVAGFAPFALLGPALGARSVTPDMDVTSPRTLTAQAVAAAVARADATAVFLSPAAIANVVATAPHLSESDLQALQRVQVVLSAGAPVSEPLLTAVNQLMPNATAHTPYGMTEGLLITSITLPAIRQAAQQIHPDGARHAGPGGVCVGKPTSTVDVRISALDDDGVAVGPPAATPDITGEVLVRGPHVKDHYDRLWLTEQRSRTVSESPGEIRDWHRTGDVGHLDASGQLWIEGRLTHVLTTAGGPVTPVGIEQRIEALPEVSRAALVGVGPPGTQQLVVVVERTTPQCRVQLADAALIAQIRAEASPDVVAVFVVPNLPTDIRHNSKIDRTKLAAWAQLMLSGARLRQP